MLFGNNISFIYYFVVFEHIANRIAIRKIMVDITDVAVRHLFDNFIYYL